MRYCCLHMKKILQSESSERSTSVITSPLLLYSSTEPLSCCTKFFPFLQAASPFPSCHVTVRLTLHRSIHLWCELSHRAWLLFPYLSFPSHSARLHTSLKTGEHIANLGCTVLTHPPNSLDLTPFVFHLFRSMKDGLHAQHFPSSDHLP